MKKFVSGLTLATLVFTCYLSVTWMYGLGIDIETWQPVSRGYWSAFLFMFTILGYDVGSKNNEC